MGYLTSNGGVPWQSDSFRVPHEDRDWGYVARVGSYLIGSSTLRHASRRTINRKAILEGAYTDNRPIVSSDGVFVFDVVNNQLLWQQQYRSSILNPSLAANDQCLFLLESPVELEKTNTGRIDLKTFLDAGAQLIALDLRTGERNWEVSIPQIDKPQKRICDVQSGQCGPGEFTERGGRALRCSRVRRQSR